VKASTDDVRIIRGRYTLNVYGRRLALDDNPIGGWIGFPEAN